MKAQLPALASSLSHSFQSSLALSVASPECLFEWPSGTADTCAGIDFLFNLKSCFKCVATKHRIDMSRLLLKFEMMMLRKNDKRTTVKQIRQSKEQLEKEEIIYRIFSSSSQERVTRLKVTVGQGIKIQAGGGVSRSQSELSRIITSGAQWLQPASITRKPSRQKTPGNNSPATGKSESNWQSWNMENISYGVWRPMLCNGLSCAGQVPVHTLDKRE